MGRNLDPKCKQCRRVGEKLFLKGERCFTSKCSMIKRNYPPGVHGPKGTKRLSEYGRQLKEKQKLIKTYRLQEKQFSNYFKKAKKMTGQTGENLLKLLEMRLDNILYQLKIFKSRDKARQIINHGHLIVNNKKVDIPSYQIKIGDIINIKPKSLENKFFKEILKKINKKELPSWLAYINEKELKIKVTNLPTQEEISTGIDVAMIVEYYSR